MTGRRAPLEVRFRAKVRERGPDDCWPWTGSIDKHGYGSIGAGGQRGRTLKAHRVAYELEYGPVPDGMTVDHECHNRDTSCPGGACSHRRCCNPRHLRATSDARNIEAGRAGEARGAQLRARTHCPQGHAYTPENTATDSRGCRSCKTCRNERKRLRRALSRAHEVFHGQKSTVVTRAKLHGLAYTR